MNEPDIRLETEDDLDGIDRLLRESFPTSLEARLVRMLRDDGDCVYSFVALEGQEIVGQALFSKLSEPANSLGLAPVAVAASRRRQGIAAALIEAGIERAKADAWQAIVVLGDPAYYQRFGFNPEAVAHMNCAYAGPYLMGLGLVENSFSGSRIAYGQAFSEIEESA